MNENLTHSFADICAITFFATDAMFLLFLSTARVMTWHGIGRSMYVIFFIWSYASPLLVGTIAMTIDGLASMAYVETIENFWN